MHLNKPEGTLSRLHPTFARRGGAHWGSQPPESFGRRAEGRGQDLGLAANLALSGIRARCRAGATLGTQCASRRSCVGGADQGPEQDQVRLRASEHPPRGSRSAALYVHWPYCEKRCSYCNFNKYIPRGLDENAMQRCLVKETVTLLKLSGVQRINSVFFGGGTPSLASPHTVASVLEAVAQTTHLPAKAEITLEANPTSSKASRLAAFRGAGINRLSIGIQSLDNTELQLLGRTHSVSEALGTLEEAKRLYPGRTSVDLMFGLPAQQVEPWLRQLQELLSLCDDHISLYQLTLERGTLLFAQVQQGTLPSPDPEAAAEMYQNGRKVLREAGFCQYEVSNFARNDALSTHNWTYWQGGQYIGVGPGAHGRFVPQGDGGNLREARIQTLEPDNWMREVSMFGHGTRKRVSLSELELLEEVLALGLRTDIGITHQAQGLAQEVA
ncbi:radical S-adenosyl methionine domain-containing protein 1, mitochondrial isoform X2 [Petaurus breviceps papuanus]|uniref:radical S-adenosyl methionine domain-containing protein 1, mitochondrial isoform X2 n=1 Tax=Petaurus breviceps papuanus TaxID=3040969 RepID=UPI0036DF272C